MPNPNTSSDPFSLLGLEPVFGLSRAQIDSAFLKRAAALHPDVSAIEEPEAARASGELNRAKEILLDHESRANALLELLGGPSKSEQKTLPDGFLMEIMETRQQIEADIGDPEKREQWELWAQRWRDGVIERVAALFAAIDSDPQNRSRVRTELNAWRYIERLIEQLDPEYNPAKADFA